MVKSTKQRVKEFFGDTISETRWKRASPKKKCGRKHKRTKHVVDSPLTSFDRTVKENLG
jgi:hypothetical protein